MEAAGQWENISIKADDGVYVLVHRQNLDTLEIAYGTIKCRIDLAKEIISRSNDEEMGKDYHMFFVEVPA